MSKREGHDPQKQFHFPQEFLDVEFAPLRSDDEQGPPAVQQSFVEDSGHEEAPVESKRPSKRQRTQNKKKAHDTDQQKLGFDEPTQPQKLIDDGPTPFAPFSEATLQSDFLSELSSAPLPVITEEERLELAHKLIERFHAYDIDPEKYKIFPRQHALTMEVTCKGKSYIIGAEPGAGKTAHMAFQVSATKRNPNSDLAGSTVIIAPRVELVYQIEKELGKFSSNRLHTEVVRGGIGEAKKTKAYESGYDALCVVEQTALIDFEKIFANKNIKQVLLDEPQLMSSVEGEKYLLKIVKRLREERPDITIQYLSGTLTKSKGRKAIRTELRAISEALGGAEILYMNRDGKEHYERPDIDIRTCKPSAEIISAAEHYKQLALHCLRDIEDSLKAKGLFKVTQRPKRSEPTVSQFLKLAEIGADAGVEGRCHQGIGYVQRYNRGKYMGAYMVLAPYFKAYTKRFFDPAFTPGDKMPELEQLHKTPSQENPHNIPEGILKLAKGTPFEILIGKRSWREVQFELRELKRHLNNTLEEELAERELEVGPATEKRKEIATAYLKRLGNELDNMRESGFRIPFSILRDSEIATEFQDIAIRTRAWGEKSDHPKNEVLINVIDESSKLMDEHPSIIFVDSVEYIQFLCDHLNFHGIKAAPYSSQYDAKFRRDILDAFNRGEHTVLVSTLDSLGTGKHIPGLRMAVIHTILKSSSNSIVQAWARIDRDLGISGREVKRVAIVVKGSPEESWHKKAFIEFEAYQAALRDTGREILPTFRLAA